VLLLAAACAAMVVCPSSPSAAVAGTTWDGDGVNTDFTTSANWDDNSAPTFTGGTSTLTFGSGGSTATVDTAADLARIILNRDAAFTIANGTGSLTLQGESVGGVVTGITASPATAGTTVAYTISESIALGATQSWNVANNGAGTTSLSVSGVISGAGVGLTKLGSGTLALSGSNTFSGSLAVAEGVLSINSWTNKNTDGPLGNSAANVILGSATSTGTLRYTGINRGTPSLVRGIELAAGGGVISMGGTWRDDGYVHISGTSISGTGPLTIDSPGGTRFIVVGSSTFSGPVTVQAGELQVNASPGSTVTVGGGSNGLGSAVTVEAGAIFNMWGSMGSATQRLGSLSGSGTVRSEGAGIQTLSVGGDDSSTAFSGLIRNSWSDASGFVALTKVGSGTLTLSGSNSYSGGTTISAGRLVVDGSILTSSGVSVESGGELGGSGQVAAITGPGLVAPGNSSGILTAPSASLSDGLDFAFEFTQAGDPTWSSAAVSGNDVLRLTDATTPLVGTSTSGNVFDIYFSGSDATYIGGIFTDLSTDFGSLLTAATFNYYVRDAGGAFSYGNFNYASLAADDVTRSTVQVASADFEGGTVTNGYAMQFVVVPEPGSLALAALGMAAVAYGCRRRRS